ncbi:hypothetical protein X566_24260 [Afipia sp. P52-10]|nr:hypothetical protein X566_24260 [Afipia sp. P52-10]
MDLSSQKQRGLRGIELPMSRSARCFFGEPADLRDARQLALSDRLCAGIIGQAPAGDQAFA